MQYVMNVWRLLSLVCVIALTGCTNTQTPVYPTQLQMIIAQSAATADAPVQQGAPKAISVEQLLADVKAAQTAPVKPNQLVSSAQTLLGQKSSSGDEQKVIHGRDSVPDWIFKGESRRKQNVAIGSIEANDALIKAQALAQTHQKSQSKPLMTERAASAPVNHSAGAEMLLAVKPNQRQLQLRYQANELLPHQMQLLMAKQMVALQQMRLVKLVIGSSNEGSTFARAATASRRAKLLIEQVSEQQLKEELKQELKEESKQESKQQTSQQNSIVVEYLPKIGDNIAIVTFQPRGR